MAKLTKDEIVAAIGELTVVELSDLVKAIEVKFDVKAAAPVAVAAAPAAGAAAAPAAAEKDEFSVILASAGDKKIEVIKVVRELTGLGLKEAKDLVDGAPKILKEQAPKAEADAMAAKFAEVGAKVTLK